MIRKGSEYIRYWLDFAMSKVREIQRILETYKTALMLHLDQCATKGFNIGIQSKLERYLLIPSN